MNLVISSRESFIISRCSGKTVLHVGACDHPFTELKFNEGTLLHTRIQSSAAQTVGLDINTESIDIAKRLGIHDIMAGAIEDVDTEKLGFSPEVIVFGEIIEHVSNPGLALSRLKSLMAMSDPNCELIITTPNAFCYKGLINAIKGIETTHPDHTMYFSEATLSRLLNLNGFNGFTIQFAFPDRGHLPWRRRLYRRMISRFFPRLAETLIATVHLRRR